MLLCIRLLSVYQVVFETLKREICRFSGVFCTD